MLKRVYRWLYSAATVRFGSPCAKTVLFLTPTGFGRLTAKSTLTAKALPTLSQAHTPTKPTVTVQLHALALLYRHCLEPGRVVWQIKCRAFKQ
jgi:hypothetical protein